MKCSNCGVVVPDDRVTFMGQPICKKCMLKGFGIGNSNEIKNQSDQK